jgi:TatD DNase family protein
MLIDSHCHLNYDYAPKTVDDLVREAREAGVRAMVTIGTELATMAEVRAISEKYPDVYHSVGVHPHDAITLSDADSSLLEEAAKHPKCRAIGEIGLDYHYDNSPREVQRQRLDQQLEIALSGKKPIVIHSRDGEDDLLESLTRYAKRLSAGSIPGIIHCFTGTEKFGRACIDLGFYISFSGIITFKKAEDVRVAAGAFPLERLLVETDSPFLAPIPHRGRKCEPSMVKLTALKLAEVKGVSFEELAQVTTQNSCKVFNISLPS